MTKTLKKTLAVLLSLAMLFSCGISVFAEAAADKIGGYYFEEGEYSIHYNVVKAQGEYKGKIMFVHGFLYSGTTWNGIAAIMSEQGYDCYLIDLPNYGYSTRETTETTIIEREQLVVDLMESIAPLDTWILAGHSMGGGVSLNIACDHPELKALMLFCPSEVYMQGNTMMTKLATSPFLGKIMDGIFGTVLKSDFIIKAAVYFTSKDMAYAKSYDARLLGDPLMIPGTGTGMLYSSVIARNTDLEAIAKIEVPALLVWGEDDNVISKDIRDNITGALNAEVKTVPGSHIVIETAPDMIAQLALDFLG